MITDKHLHIFWNRYSVPRYKSSTVTIVREVSGSFPESSLSVELDSNLSGLMKGYTKVFQPSFVFIHDSVLEGSVAPVSVGFEFLSPTSNATRNLLTPL